jgi:hypothetical protein
LLLGSRDGKNGAGNVGSFPKLVMWPTLEILKMAVLTSKACFCSSGCLTGDLTV